jgi:hypothetical protein
MLSDHQRNRVALSRFTGASPAANHRIAIELQDYANRIHEHWRAASDARSSGTPGRHFDLGAAGVANKSGIRIAGSTQPTGRRVLPLLPLPRRHLGDQSCDALEGDVVPQPGECDDAT